MPGTQVKDDPAAPANGDAAKAPVARRTPAVRKPPAEAAALVIKPIRTELLEINIVGMTPLIVSRFSEKAKAQMLAAQQGKKRQPEKRDPRREFLASLYRAGIDPDTDEVLYGLPAMAFKMATIGAGRFWGKQVKMTELRQFMTFYGVSVPSEAGRMVVLNGRPRMREDYVRLAGVNHPADLRYRGCFYQWSATLVVGYTSNLLERDSVVSLIEAGGGNVGVGEWRPERNGEFGTFRVASGKGAVTVIDRLDPKYELDTVDYEEAYGEEEVLTMADFAELDAAPEVLAEEPAEDDARPAKEKEAGPDRTLTDADRAAMAGDDDAAGA
jgi:hypothetical protein